MKTARGLVSYVKDKVGKPYLYGFKQNYNWDKICTKKDYDRLKKTWGNNVWAEDKPECVGKKPCDCSGLISAYTEIQRSSTEHKNKATKVLPISQIDKAVPGCLLWMQGHIGVYIGNGEYIAEDGSKYDCRKAKLNASNASKFTHILWSKDIKYPIYKIKTTVFNVKVRTSAATKSNTKIVKKLAKGSERYIYTEKVVGKYKYGQLYNGNWICLKYTKKV